jgi:hypothetical protein
VEYVTGPARQGVTAFVSVASANKLKHMEGTVLTAADLYDLVVKFRFE